MEMLKRLGMVSEFDWGKYASSVDAQNRLADLVNRNYFETLMAQKVHINPNQVNNFQQWLARHFPTFAKHSDQASEIRRFMLNAKKAGENLWDVMPFYAGQVDEMLAKIGSADVIKDAYETFKNTLKASGVYFDKDTLGRLWINAVEVGQTERILRVTDAGENGKRVLQTRYDRFIEKLAGHGISEEGAQVLLDAAGRVSKAYDDLLVAAQNVGVDVGAIQDIGYFNRILSADAKFRLGREQADLYGEFLENKASGLGVAFQKSRLTNDFIVEDELILAAALDKVPYTKAQIEQLRKEGNQELLDMAQEYASVALNGVLTNEKKLLTELAGLSDSTLDALVDSGVLSKLPTLTEDVYKYMVERYKMPYKGLEELMITDPQRAYQAATDQLKQLMGKSVMSQAMFKDAIDKGWGITASDKLADPKKYSKYVKLSDEVYKRFGIDAIPGADNVYLHPTVADMYTGILEVATDPAQLSTFASVWQYVNRIFKKQTLATTGFLGRQVYQLFVSSAISGTNLANLIPGIYDYIRFKRLGLEVFDNTKKVYAGGKYTERELMVELFKRGAIDNLHHTTPIAGQISMKASETYGALNPKNAARALSYWGSIINGRGVFPRIKDGKLHWDAVEYGADLFERLTDEASGFLMSNAVFLENAAKLAHYRSTLKDGAANAIGQYITNGKRFHFTDVDDAVKHAHDYFFDYEDVGVGDRFISKNIIPFWVYMSRNTPAVIRHALRNPTQYMAYQRIYALMNQDVRQSGEDAPEGGFASWQTGKGHVYLRHPSGDPNKWLHIPFTPFDPIADATNTLEAGVNGLAQMFGFLPGRYKDDIAQVSPKNHTIPFLDTVVEQGYGSIKALAAVIGTKDPRTDKELIQDETKTTSFLGVEIPGKHAPLIKFLIENTLPSVANLNRFNPGGVFGLKETKDGRGNVVRKAQPSLFGVARSDADTKIDDLSGNPAMALVRLSGLTVDSVDTIKNMGYSEAELTRTVRDMKAYANKLQKAIDALPPDDGKRSQLQDQLLTVKALGVEMEQGRTKTEKWLNSRGALTASQQKARDKELERYKAYLELFGKR